MHHFSPLYMGKNKYRETAAKPTFNPTQIEPYPAMWHSLSNTLTDWMNSLIQLFICFLCMHLHATVHAWCRCVFVCVCRSEDNVFLTLHRSWRSNLSCQARQQVCLSCQPLNNPYWVPSLQPEIEHRNCRLSQEGFNNTEKCRDLRRLSGEKNNALTDS